MSINNNPAPVAPSFALETIQNDVDKALTFLDDKKSVGRNARKIIVCKEIKKFLINNPDVRKGIINDSINFLNKISNKAMKLTILTKILKKNPGKYSKTEKIKAVLAEVKNSSIQAEKIKASKTITIYRPSCG